MASLLEEEIKYREENPHLFSSEDLDEENQHPQPKENLDPENQGGTGSETYDMGALPQMCETRQEDISGRGRIGGQHRVGRLRRGIEQRRQQQHDSNLSNFSNNNSNESKNSRYASKNPAHGLPGNVPSNDCTSATQNCPTRVAKQSHPDVASAGSKGVGKESLDNGSKAVAARDLWREQFDCPGHNFLLTFGD